MSAVDYLEYTAIPLSQIDIDDIRSQSGAYCMSYGYDPTPLLKSMEKVGLINPPFLVAKSAGCFDVVSGYRRILAARSLGWEKIFFRDLTDLKMTTLDLLLLNLYENLSTRSFNEIEKAMVIKRLSLHVSHEGLLRDYMPLLGLSPYERVLRTYLLLEELDEPVRAGVAEGTISSQAAKLLLDLEAGARLAIYECILDLRLNANYQKQLIEYLVEISEIENTSIHEILSRAPLTQIFEKKPTNSPQKAKSLLGALRIMRNPRIADAEHRFQQQLSSIHLPSGTRIMHSPFFEDPSFTLEMTFEDGRGLKEKILRMSETDGIENIRMPWLKQDDK